MSIFLDCATFDFAILELKYGIVFTEFNKTEESWSLLAEPLWINPTKLRLDYMLGHVNLSYMRAFLTSGAWVSVLRGGILTIH